MTSTPATEPISRSTFARVALLVYALLILYASWYPFTGWRDIGVAPLAYLGAPFPHYWTLFDVSTNILAYIPFGMLLVLALYPLVRGSAALLLVLFAATLWSGTMEAVQTFLPTRVSSNLDLLTNVSGAVIGALIGLASCDFFVGHSRLHRLQLRWFSPQASRGLIVIGTWPLSQIYPQGYLFGHGQLMPILANWLADTLGFALVPLSLIWPDLQLSVQQFWLAETVITAFGMTGAVLILFSVLRPNAPGWPLALLLIGLVLAVKSMASALLFAPENAFVWLTPGARGGLLLGAIMLIGLRLCAPHWQRRAAVLMLLLCFCVVNLVPPNPYFVVTLQRWVQGKFLSFNGATQFMALLWPFLACWFLLHVVHKNKPAQVS